MPKPRNFKLFFKGLETYVLAVLAKDPNAIDALLFRAQRSAVETLVTEVTDNVGSIESDEKIFTYADPVPVENQRVVLNCLQADIFNLKQPAVKTKVYADTSVAALLRALMPGVKQDVAAFPAGLTHHVITGERPSKALRQAALELGACVYYQRGTVFMKKLFDLLAAKSKVECTSNDLRVEHQIALYTKPNTE